MNTMAAPRAIAKAETLSEAFSPSQDALEPTLPATFGVEVEVEVDVDVDVEVEVAVAAPVASDKSDW